MMDAERGRWILWYNGRTGTQEYIGMAEKKGLDLGPAAEPYNKVLKDELVRRRFDRFAFDDEELYANAFSNRTARWTKEAPAPHEGRRLGRHGVPAGRPVGGP